MLSTNGRSTRRRPAPKGKVVIHVEDPNPTVDPVVASFPGGLSPDELPQFAWRKLREKSERGKSLVGKDSTCLYQARNEGRGYDGRRTKLCVGVYNRQTGKLTIHQAAEKGTVFCVEQSVRRYQDSSAQLSEQTMSSLERRRALFESFGSSKKQKVLKSQQANVVNVNSVVGAGSVMMGAWESQAMSESNRQAMEQAKSGNKMDAIESAYDEARRKFLPKFDADATEPHLVYDARDMAGNDAWGQVSRVSDACLRQDNLVAALTSRGQWYDSVVTVLKSMTTESPSAKYQIKCATLLNHMIHFHRCNRSFLKGSVEEISQQMRLPLEITTRYLDLFATPITDERTGQSGYASSKQNKDKCGVHILLLYMMAQGRTMKVGNIKPVADDVKIELGEAANLLRNAGCKVKNTGKGTMSATLTVPLTFPPSKRRRR